MDTVERYKAIVRCMFSDHIVNRGRLLVLKVYTDSVCDTVELEVAQKIREAYWKFISEFNNHGSHAFEIHQFITKKSP